MLETAEFFADESDDAYWRFVEVWVATAGSVDAKVDFDAPDFFATCASRLADAARSTTNSTLSMGVLELSLGVRRYSPRLEMFRTLAATEFGDVDTSSSVIGFDDAGDKKKECCRAKFGDATASDVGTLETMLRDVTGLNTSVEPEKRRCSIYHESKFDHVYPAPAPATAPEFGNDPGVGTGSGFGAQKTPPTVTLYASLGSDCFGGFHETLARFAKNASVVYVHRPVVLESQCAHQADGCVALGAFGASDHGAYGKHRGDDEVTQKSEKGLERRSAPRLAAAGFGVEMAIKNMEYKAVDDSGGGGGSDKASGDGSDKDSVPGSDTEHGKETPEAHLLEVKNLGLQATQRVVDSADPLQAMIDLSFNFPEIAPALSHTTVDDLTRSAVMENTQKLSGGGSLVLSLNGEPLEMDVVNIFVLLDRICDELKIASVFRDVDGLDSLAVKKLLRLRMPAQGSSGSSSGGHDDPPRLDIVLFTETAPVKFGNDVEKDGAYKKWDKSVTGLVSQTTQRNGPPQVRRNLLNIIAVVRLGEGDVDPNTRASWAFVDALGQASEQGIGARVAHVLLPDDSEVEVGDAQNANHASAANTRQTDPSLPPGVSIATAMARAHAVLARRFGGRYAMLFLKDANEARPVQREAGNPFAPPLRSGAPRWSDCERAFAKAHKRGFRARAKYEFKKKTGKDKKHAPNVDDDAVAKDLAVTLGDIADLTASSSAAKYVTDATSFLERRGVEGPAGLVNGLYFTAQHAQAMGADLTSLAFHYAQRELAAAARAVFSGELTDELADADPRGAYGWAHRNAVTKRSAFLEKSRDTTYVVMKPPADNTLFAYLGDGGTSQTGDGDGTKVWPGVTAWVVADAGTESGAALIAAARGFLARDGAASDRDASQTDLPKPNSPSARVAVLHPPTEGAPCSNALLAKQGKFVVNTIGQNLAQRVFEKNTNVTGLVIINGRVVEVYNSQNLDADDIAALVSFEATARGDAIAAVRFVDVDDTDETEKTKGKKPWGKKETWKPRGKKDSKARSPSTRTQMADTCMHAVSLVARRHFLHEKTGAGAKGQVVDLQFLESRRASFVSSDSSGSDETQTQEAALITLEAVLDPLSPEARRVAPVLKILRDALAPHVCVRVILNPKLNLEKLPLNSFYRYAEPGFRFPKSGSAGTGVTDPKNGKTGTAPRSGNTLNTPTDENTLTPHAFFASLPTKQTLTAHLDVPEQWLVTTAIAAYDLDNVRLEDLPVGENVMIAEYRLEALLVTGHCSETPAADADQSNAQYTRHNPPPSPRGTQLLIDTSGTIVMSNLGYFQLPTLPGARTLRIREGRSAEVYRFATSGGLLDLDVGADSLVKALLDVDAGVETVEETATPTADDSAVSVVVASWNGRVVRVALTKRKGMELEDVLEEAAAWSDKREAKRPTHRWFGSFFGPGKGAPKNDENLGAEKEEETSVDISPQKQKYAGDTIHVFSVASGHLYERFLKIMMLSVRRNTNNPVKFWFIKNWLSPRFKDFLPHIALQYGFEYELVTYKWPTWLRRQTEKQRIIWAYKVRIFPFTTFRRLIAHTRLTLFFKTPKLLFLDVLFPLTLDKIIFVDADQVVRADLKELWDMDLHGAPYAYTPMCDNNKEMEGYRFWKTGFWKNHLRGKPYHISALYVVDLKRFRKTAAGDQLRVIYEQLSQDPNSLANLDQDLPNYAQLQVPIFSLPQNWLWCESWCGNETKANAKTIDLCNNPMTKEPKLLGAARIVKEWPGLDNEVRHFTADVERRLYGGKQFLSHQERVARNAAAAASGDSKDEL